MAKRVRGSRSAHRPGGQGPSRAKKTSGSAAPAPVDVAPASADEYATEADEYVTEADEFVTDAGSGEVEVDEVAVAALAAAGPSPEQTGQVRSPRRARRKARKQRPDDLAARAAAEDVWVREDLRRIGIVSVVLLVALALAWVVFAFLDVLNLY